MSNLRNRLSDNTLPKRMRIAIEGPELSTVDFTEILAAFKREKNIVLNFEFALTIVMKFKNSGGGDFSYGERKSQCPLPTLYEMLCMQKFCQGVGANLGVLTEGGTSAKQPQGKYGKTLWYPIIHTCSKQIESI